MLLAIRMVLITTFSKDADDKSSIIRDIRTVQTKKTPFPYLANDPEEPT